MTHNPNRTRRSPFSLWLLLLFCLPLLTSCDSRSIIVNALDEKEANEIIVFLSGKGIDAQKVVATDAGGTGAQKGLLFDITVPEEEKSRALFLLNREGLPRRPGQNLLTIFKEAGLVPSEKTEKIRYQAGLAAQAASTIRKIDGVMDAEVQISFPEEDPLNPGKSKGEITASVYVKHSGILDDPNSHLMTKIKRLVAASITGLKYDNVTIISDRARFTDFPLGLPGIREEEKQYVKTWGIVIAKESLLRFRIIFFSFSILLLFLLLNLIWIGWKLYPVLEEKGGIASLFSLSPLATPSKSGSKRDESEEEEENEDQEEETEDEEDEDGTPPRDVT